MGFGDEGSFSINYRNDGDDDIKDMEFASLEDAMSKARRLVSEDEYDTVSVWEYGSYFVGTSEREGYVLIWHHPETDEDLQGIRGRGARITDKGRIVPVDYTPVRAPEDEDVETAQEEDDEEEDEEESDYASVQCEQCGKRVPISQAKEYSGEDRAGRSSGSSRGGSSSPRRQGQRRTPYLRKSEWLCEECYSATRTDDRMWFVLKWGFYIAVGAVILYLGLRYG
ncbi:hypothetical protein JQ543_19800 [Bradyrhizobium diazoefficiens]|nr:hypothetical protein [Bradyrhizobium diazoefficiens]MBR0850006.1 hypothetical protein [Bradyrhizobium diazoefficiens]